MLLQMALLHSFLWLSNIPLTSQVVQVVKNPPANAGDADSKKKKKEIQVPSLGQEYPLEKGMATHCSISCLENSMDRGAWQATVQGVTKSQTQLSMHTPQYSIVYTTRLTYPFIC